MPFPASWVTDAVCLLLCVAAARTDLRERRIPNALTFGGFGVGLALSFGLTAGAGGVAMGLREGLGPAVGGAALLFGVFLLIGLLGAVGMGDVKLMGTVGVLVGWPLAYRVLVDVLVAGTFVAIAHGVANGKLGAVLGNIGRAIRSPFGKGRPREQDLHPMPYAVAILLGTTWAVLGRYLPVLRFP